MLYQTSVILPYITFASAALFLAGAAWQRYGRLQPAMRILPWLLSLMLTFVLLIQLIWPGLYDVFPVLYVYTLLEAGLITLYFRKLLSGFVPDLLLWIGFLLFSVLTLVYATYQPQNRQPDMLPRCVEGLCVIVLCAASYYRMLQQLRIKKLYRDPVFIVNIGLLLYFSEPIFQLIIHPYMSALHPSIPEPEWILHGLSSLLLFVFVFVGLLQEPHKYA